MQPSPDFSAIDPPLTPLHKTAFPLYQFLSGMVRNIVASIFFSIIPILPQYIPYYNIVASIFFSIIPILPQYIPYYNIVASIFFSIILYNPLSRQPRLGGRSMSGSSVRFQHEPDVHHFETDAAPTDEPGLLLRNLN